MQQVRGDGVVNVIQGVAAVGHFRKLEVVVVIQGLDAVGFAGLADLFKQLHVALKLGGAGTVLFHQVGDGNVFHADLHILLDGALHIRHQILEGDMGRQGHQARVLNGGFHLLGGQAIQPGQLHAIVADLFNFFHSAGEVFFRVFTDRINLHGNRQSFHGVLLLIIDKTMPHRLCPSYPNPVERSREGLKKRGGYVRVCIDYYILFTIF